MSARTDTPAPSFWSDVGTVVWKEFKEMGQQQSVSRVGRGWTGALIFLFVFGVFMPWQFGEEWVTSPATLVYWAWVPILLASSIVAQSFAGERERHTLESLLATRLSDLAILIGKVVAVVAYAWGITLAALLLGLITTNLLHREAGLLLFPTDIAVSIVGITLLVSVLAAAAGVLVSLRAGTVRQAQQTMSFATLVLVFGSVYGLQALPVDWEALLGRAAGGSGLPSGVVLAVAGILVVLDAALLVAASMRFRRTRLILD